MQKAMAILLILLATILVQIGVGVSAIIFPLQLDHLGYNNAEIGIVLALELFAVVCISGYINKMLTRFGLFKALLLATIIRVVVLYILADLENFWGWLVCVFFLGMATNVFLISLQTWLGAISLVRFSGLIVGIYSAVLSAGVAIGPLALDLVGIQGPEPFYYNAILSGLTFVPFILGFYLIPKLNAGSTLRIWFSLKNAPIVMSSAFVGGITFFGLPAFSTLVGIQSGLPVEKAAYLLTSFMSGSIVLGLAIGFLSDFVGRQAVTIICVFIGIACSVYFPLAIVHYNIVMALLFVWGGVMSAIFGMGLATINGYFRKEDLVSANITYGLMDCLGGVIGVFLIGATIQIWNVEGLSYVIVSAGVIYFTFVLSRKQIMSF